MIVELEIALQTLLCLGDRILAGKATIEQVYNEGKDELYQWKKVGDVGQDAGMKKPERTPWTSALSRVDIMADTPIVQGHPAYQAAKQGDLNAAMRLVSDVMSDAQLNRLREKYRNDPPLLAGVQAIEGASVNVIPQAMVARLAQQTGFEMESSLVQINRVGHTKSTGWHRIVYQALFDGEV